MPSKEKLSAVAEITDHFANSSAAVITEYRGLTVRQVTQLRRALGNDTVYAVVKNTLTRRAAADAGVTIDASLLVGPTAIAFIHGDPVLAAKGLRDFARANPLLIIKGGVLEGKTLSAAEVSRIAELESREVLLARLAGALKALPTRAASLFQAPLSQMARLAKALEEQKAAGAPAPDTTAPDTTAPDTTAPDTTAPDTTAPDTTAPDTTAPDTTAPEEPPSEPATESAPATEADAPPADAAADAAESARTE